MVEVRPVSVDNWSMDDVELVCEVRGLYDGWSWAILKDGSAVNRWARSDYADDPFYDYRRTETQVWVDNHNSERNSDAFNSRAA